MIRDALFALLVGGWIWGTDRPNWKESTNILAGIMWGILIFLILRGMTFLTGP